MFIRFCIPVFLLWLMCLYMCFTCTQVYGCIHNFSHFTCFANVRVSSAPRRAVGTAHLPPCAILTLTCPYERSSFEVVSLVSGTVWLAARYGLPFDTGAARCIQLGVFFNLFFQERERGLRRCVVEG